MLYDHRSEKVRMMPTLRVVEQSLSNALRLETYVQDAEREGDTELAELFRRAQEASRKGAEQGKDQLRKRLAS